MERLGADSVVLRFRLPRVPWLAGPRWLLWPALAWRVVAPSPRPRKLNVLQRAVLGLCVAGTTRAEEIGTRLLIATDLAALIVTELQGNGWLDVRGTCTDAGRRTLEDDESEAVHDQTVGWVFTDPFSGETWPRFHAGELPHANVESPARDRWTLVTGTAGNPRREPAFEVRPRGGEAVRRQQPRPEDVLRAVRAHRRHHAWEDEPVAADAPVVQRVSFVSELPTACLLAVRTWLAAPGEWRVDDPFGIGDSVRLRRWIEERLDDDHGLHDWLAPVAGGDPEATDPVSLAQAAAWEIETALTIAIRERRAFHERLVAMQRALKEAEVDGSPADKWDDVAVKAQRAAERLFLELCNAHSPRTRLTQDRDCNMALVDQLAAAAGFEAPLPPSLSRVRGGKIEHAAREGSGSLRPLVLLALLGTAGFPEHPLARAARAEPRLLHRLDALASTRDRAAHEGPSHVRRALSERHQPIREGVETVIAATKLLLTT
jgi:hypothetical protein